MNILQRRAQRPLQRVQRDARIHDVDVGASHIRSPTDRPRSHWRVHVPEMARGRRDQRDTATVNKVHAVMANTHPARTLTQAVSDNSRARRIS